MTRVRAIAATDEPAASTRASDACADCSISCQYSDCAMHPDKKVGLSLGILLIGVTAAFFFRNDVPLDEEQAPELVDAQSLDDQIRRKAQTPYLPERVEDSIETETPQVRDVQVADVIPQTPQLSQSIPDTPLPGPIRPVEEAPAGRIAPIPHPSVDPDEVDQALARADANRQNGDQAAGSTGRSNTGVVIHEVVAKDTLSGISQKYLGSFRRYREIFEANRDKLDSPDDIREGMKLRIPTGTADGATEKKPVQSADARPVSSGEDKPETKKPADDVVPPRPSFIRPKSRTRLPGRRTTQTGGRSLSQEAPPGLPIVENFNPDQVRTVLASREAASEDGPDAGSEATESRE